MENTDKKNLIEKNIGIFEGRKNTFLKIHIKLLQKKNEIGLQCCEDIINVIDGIINDLKNIKNLIDKKYVYLEQHLVSKIKTYEQKKKNINGLLVLNEKINNLSKLNVKLFVSETSYYECMIVILKYIK